MKRMISGILAITLAFAMSACGTTSKKAKSDKNVTLTWLVPSDKQLDIETVLEAANKIIEPAIGAKLDLQFIDAASYKEKMKLYMASAKDYDLCFTGFMNNYQSAAIGGGLMDITDLIDKQAPKLKELVPDYILKSAYIKGKIYGIPNQQVISNPDCLDTFADLVKKYKFDFSTVKKMDDIEPYLKMLKAGESNIYPYRPLIRGWWYNTYDNVLDNTNVVFKKDGSSTKLVLLHETKEYLEGVHKLREWYEKGYIRPDVASVGDDNTDLKNGKYGVFHSSWKPGDEVGFKFTYGREGAFALLHEPYVQRTSSLMTMISIGAKSKNPEKALKFIELINGNKDLYNLICFGIEGKHYNLTPEGKVKYIENSGYAPKSDWKFGNQFNALLVDGMADDVYIKTQKMNDEAKKSIFLGFVPDTSTISNQMSQIESVNSEFNVRGNGAADPATYWDTYMKKLEAAGQQKVLEELQRQVDEFLKNKK
jgi:putative aldouronate transport system substrate-binding protein